MTGPGSKYSDNLLALLLYPPGHDFATMYRPKERYNAKARQSSTSHKKKGRKKKDSLSDPQIQDVDVNADIVVPKSQEQKELDRKERLTQEVYPIPTPWISIDDIGFFRIAHCTIRVTSQQ